MFIHFHGSHHIETSHIGLHSRWGVWFSQNRVGGDPRVARRRSGLKMGEIDPARGFLQEKHMMNFMGFGMMRCYIFRATHWLNIHQDASRLEAARCECEIQELLDCLGSSWFVLKIGYHDAPKSNGIIKWYTIIIYHTVVYHSHFPSQNRQGYSPFSHPSQAPRAKVTKSNPSDPWSQGWAPNGPSKIWRCFVCCLQSCFSPERSTMLIWSHLFSMGLFSFSGNRPWTPLDWRSTPCRRGWSLILAESPIWVHRLGGFLLDMVANREVCARLQRFHQS